MIEETSGNLWNPAVHRLWRDYHGRLNFADEAGVTHAGVLPVRAFPIDAPDELISLVSADGHELAFIPLLSALDGDSRRLLTEEIAQREFLPVIERLLSVSTFSTPSSWHVQTDRGETTLVLKGEEEIRRLGRGGILLTDSHGVTYRINDIRALDRASRKLLDRFL